MSSSKAVGTSRRIHLWLFPTEGLSHAVPGAGVRQPQGGSGSQKPAASPAGEEADGTGKAGKLKLGADGINCYPQPSSFPLFFLTLQKDKNVKLDESLSKVQQENEHLKARMDRHAALSR